MRSARMVPVILERPQNSRDADYNEATPRWVVEAETFAEKRVLTGRERFVDDMHQSTVDVEWRFRYRAVLDPRWRIREVRTGELHQIDSVPGDPDGRRRVIVVRSSTYRPDSNAELVV